MYDATPKHRRRACPASIAVMAIGFTLTIIGDALYVPHAVTIGFAVLLLGATCLVAIRTGVNTEILERTRQAGYDAGYDDALGVTRPTLVSLRDVG